MVESADAIVTKGIVSGVKYGRAVPQPPSSFTLSYTSSSNVRIAWSAASTGASGYYIKRSTDLGGPYTTVGIVPTGTQLYYVNGGLITAQTYYYKVSAFVVYGGVRYEGESSDYQSIKALPGKPVISSVTSVGSTSLKVTWGMDSAPYSRNAPGHSVSECRAGERSHAMVKLIYDPADRTPKAMVIVCLRSSLLRKLLPQSDRYFKTSTFYLLDEADRVIYSSGNAGLSDDEVGQALHSTQDNGYLLSSTESSITGWTLVNAVERKELNAMVNRIGLSAIALAALLTLVALVLSNVATRYLNRSLTHLKKLLEEINRKGGSIQEDFDDSEIGQIGRVLKSTYNHNLALQERMLKLEVQERESELRLLQAQINPHFLYNTLDSIYSSAIVSHDDQTAQMVASLSGLFRISLSKGKRAITVRDELTYIQRYMTIQNIRFQDRFALIVDVDDNVLDLTILKLTLQPFVENAMIHGLEPKIGKGYIEIKGERIDDDLYFTVSDNGVGVEDLERFYEGYGIRNVIDRIHLFYGPTYGVEIQSTPDHGTSVRIHISAKEGNTNVEAGDL